MPTATPLSNRQLWLLVAIAVPAASAIVARVYIMRNVASYTSHRLESTKKNQVRKAGRGTVSSSSTSSISSSSVAMSAESHPPLPKSLKLSSTVANNTNDDFLDDHIVLYERVVSKSVLLPLHSKRGSVVRSDGETDDETTHPKTKKEQRMMSSLLTDYIRATMFAFTFTPQAALLRKMVPDEAKVTFDQEYITALDFETLGQRVNGVYTVQYRGNGDEPAESIGSRSVIEGKEQQQEQKQYRVELKLDPPEGYTGPKGEGVIVVAVEGPQHSDTEKGFSKQTCVVFINETWLWRKEGERPTLLESVIGRWAHSLMAGWLITRGITALRENIGK